MIIAFAEKMVFRLLPSVVTLTTICLLSLVNSPAVTADETAPQRIAQAKSDSKHPKGALLPEKLFPTAAVCGTCHTQIYKEWASSNHAYASISPMFHKFEQKINDIASGTIGSFCVRCHQSVGT